MDQALAFGTNATTAAPAMSLMKHELDEVAAVHRCTLFTLV
jgi:hypothetical protein